jgi:ubiquinone/menaquinone biosynthesis C-methylase UbiE
MTQQRRDMWWRARGLEQLNARFAEPSVLTTLDARLAAGRPMRVLEIGCGEAHALMALAWRYRDRPLALVGLNDTPTETMATADDLRDACVDFAICTREEAARLRLPELVFADAGERLPFRDGTFDLVVSGLTFHSITEKAHALTETWRVLDQDGTALIHLDSFDPGMPDFMNTPGNPRWFTPRFVIYDNQHRRLPTFDYLVRFAAPGFDVRLESSPGRPAHSVVRFNRQTKEPLDLGLTLDGASTLPNMQLHSSFTHAISDDWRWGTRSVYFTK